MSLHGLEANGDWSCEWSQKIDGSSNDLRFSKSQPSMRLDNETAFEWRRSVGGCCDRERMSSLAANSSIRAERSTRSCLRLYVAVKVLLLIGMDSRKENCCNRQGTLGTPPWLISSRARKGGETPNDSIQEAQNSRQ